MGYFHYVHEVSSTRRRRSLGLAVALVLLWAAPMAAADASDASEADADALDDGRAVSTSPMPRAAVQPAAPMAQHPTHPDHPPLTRAAARLQIDSISPRDWLAHFGPVDVTHRN